MIGPGGLLLVVHHLFVVPLSVLWVGLQKSKWINLDVKNIFCKVPYWAPLEMLYKGGGVLEKLWSQISFH
jgi:hypothetical protein